MIKLKNILNEIPIDLYKTIGDFNKSGSFNDRADRQKIKDPNSIKKVRDFFKNTTVDFDFYFINLNINSDDISYEMGEMEEKDIYSYFNIEPNQLIGKKINKNNVTVFFTNNEGDDKMTMTPWIMGHRFIHAISDSQNKHFGIWRDWLKTQFESLIQSAFGLSDRNLFWMDPDSEFSTLFNIIGTMKSARNNRIRDDSPFEFFIELLVQYLNSGNIRLNKLNRNSEIEGNKIKNVNLANKILLNIERSFNTHAESIFSECKGKIYYI